MAVAFESYNTPTLWTPDNARDTFEEAFKDAGILPVGGWYDSFDVGALRHGVVEIVHDNTKTYGTTYYWFIFSTNRIHIHFCTVSWNTTTHLPSGAAECLDHQFWSAPVNTTTDRHHRFMSPANNITLQLVRYTSTVDPTFTVFVVKNGSTENVLFFHRGAPNPTFCDLDKNCYMGIYELFQTHNIGTTVGFHALPVWIRRYFLGGLHAGAVSSSLNTLSNADWLAHLPGETSNQADLVCKDTLASLGYFFPAFGKTFNASYNEGVPGFTGSTGSVAVRMPIYSRVVNPAHTFASPIFNGIPYSMYSPQLIPADFGWAATYNNNTIQTFDRYIITESSNEWEVLEVRNQNREAEVEEPTTMFLARVV